MSDPSAPSLIAGCVLAAGASSRMGQPKALLPLPDGRTLAQFQCDTLLQANCDRVVVVVGCAGERLRAALPGLEVVINARWAEGRLTSVQCGLEALRDADRIVIVPVDTPGLRPATIVRLLAEEGEAIRPVYRGAPGMVRVLSRKIARDICEIKDPNTRLDEWLAPREARVEVDDPAVTHNLNVPAEWEAWRSTLPAD